MLKLGNTYLKYGDTYLTDWKAPIKPDPYNPLGLPPYTIRLVYFAGATPTFSKGTATQVSQELNIWDLTYENSNWNQLLYHHEDLCEVLGANTTGVTSMSYMFNLCYSLYNVQIFDTSSVTDMNTMFGGCTSLSVVPLFDTNNVTSMKSMFINCGYLTTIPLFNTNKVTDVDTMFSNCTNVQFGAYNLYIQMSTQTNPPLNHNRTFYNCGDNYSIPSDWK